MATEGKPTVDVIIAARNEARHLGACLDSIAAQHYPLDLVRVFVVDNGSTDATPAIATAYPATKLSVTLLRQPKPGAAASRNAGIALGSGELLALLDAHCTIDAGWIASMAARFADPLIGGCQARIDSRSVSPRIQRYLTESGELSNDRILDDTVSGRRNIYPWILSGNSMYRRVAAERAGGFDETLTACEDVDLAWRVVLLGYHLAYVPESVAVHYDGNSWYRFLRKGLTYGAGAAELARRYAPHGATNKFDPPALFSASIERSLATFYYTAGYRSKDVRLRLGIDAMPTTVPHVDVLEEFRQRFAWTERVSMRVAPSTIYWFRGGDEPASIVVHVPSRQRIVLTEAGDFIWRRLARGESRSSVVAAMAAYYSIADVTAAADLDDLVDELVAAGVLERESA
jgi:glycosyltransferase involved in cell wall biosynthesis